MSNNLPGPGHFQTTQWSEVLSARKIDSSPDSEWRPSLESLCRKYWLPLYFYLRKKGYAEPDSQDLTQDFFHSLIEKDFLKAVDPERGRFRWFLMDAISKFAAKWNAAQAAQKRGGDRQIFSLSFEEGEHQYRNEPVDDLTPERAFDRQWAMTLLQSALVELQQEYEKNGKTRYFNHLQVFLTADSQRPKYSEVAEQLGLTETAVKVAIFRLREKYQMIIRRLVADTLDDQSHLDAEIDELLASL